MSLNRDVDPVDSADTDSVSISIEDQIRTHLDRAMPKAAADAASKELSEILIYIYVIAFITVAILLYTLIGINTIQKRVDVFDRQKRKTQEKINDLQHQIEVLQVRARPSKTPPDDFLKASVREDRGGEISSRPIKRSGDPSNEKPEIASRTQTPRMTTPASPVEMYNKVILKEINEEEFKRTFEPRRVEVFDLENNIRVREGVTGNLWCVKHSSKYYLLPKYGTIFTTAVRKSGGGDVIFDCASYKQGVDYEIVRVKRPAIVELVEGKYWELVESGKIELTGN
jgi:hypothetical protein